MKSYFIFSFVLFFVLCDFVQGKYTVYWNAPTNACHKHGIYFELSQFNIIQNTDDKFAGDKVCFFLIFKSIKKI